MCMKSLPLPVCMACHSLSRKERSGRGMKNPKGARASMRLGWRMGWRKEPKRSWPSSTSLSGESSSVRLGIETTLSHADDFGEVPRLNGDAFTSATRYWRCLMRGMRRLSPFVETRLSRLAFKGCDGRRDGCRDDRVRVEAACATPPDIHERFVCCIVAS